MFLCSLIPTLTLTPPPNNALLANMDMWAAVNFSQSLPSTCCILASKLFGNAVNSAHWKYDSHPYLAESIWSRVLLEIDLTMSCYGSLLDNCIPKTIDLSYELLTSTFSDTVITQAAILHSQVHEVRQSSISLCINVFGMLSEFISTVCCIATNNYACPSRLFTNLKYSRKAGHMLELYNGQHWFISIAW